MWGDPIRTTPDGRGIPCVKKVAWTAYWSDAEGRHEEDGVSWDVTLPDSLEFECCGLTEGRTFETWADALKFALGRSWER
jgi:hypothetical protein